MSVRARSPSPVAQTKKQSFRTYLKGQRAESKVIFAEFLKFYSKAQSLVDKLNESLAKKGVESVSITVGNVTHEFRKTDSRAIQRFIVRQLKELSVTIPDLIVPPVRESVPQDGPKPVSQLVKPILPTQALTNFVIDFFPDLAEISVSGTGQWYQTLVRRYLNDNGYSRQVDGKTLYYLPDGEFRQVLSEVTDVNLDSFPASQVPTLVSNLIEKDEKNRQILVESTSAAGAEAFTTYRQLFTARKNAVIADKKNVGRNGADPTRRGTNKSDVVTVPKDYTDAAVAAGIINAAGQALNLGDENNISINAYKQDMNRAEATQRKRLAEKAAKATAKAERDAL